MPLKLCHFNFVELECVALKKKEKIEKEKERKKNQTSIYHKEVNCLVLNWHAIVP